jgi:ketol-acid reductoisomerase
MGYGPEARARAIALRDAGWEVQVVVRPGGMSWIRAVSDGLRPVPAREAVSSADVVSVHVPDSEQPAVWAQTIAPYLLPDALVVFERGSALYSGSVDPSPELDVVLVTTRDEPAEVGPRACRIAVHHDASGHALERAAWYARVALGSARIGTTTVYSEVRAELMELVGRMGGISALVAEWDRVLANPSHEPDEAALRYYERLRAAVVGGDQTLEIPRPPASQTQLPGEGPRQSGRPAQQRSHKRGAA